MHRNLALRVLSVARQRFPDELSAHEAAYAAGIIALWDSDPEQAGELFRSAINLAYKAHAPEAVPAYERWARVATQAHTRWPKAEPVPALAC